MDRREGSITQILLYLWKEKAINWTCFSSTKNIYPIFYTFILNRNYGERAINCQHNRSIIPLLGKCNRELYFCIQSIGPYHQSFYLQKISHNHVNSVLIIIQQLNNNLANNKLNWEVILPCFLSLSLLCRNPLNGAKPVPGPTIITGVVERKGSLNCDFLTFKE